MTLVKIREDLFNLQQTINNPHIIANVRQILNDISDGIDRMKLKFNTICILMDFNDTFTWKINCISLLEGQSSVSYSNQFQSSNCGYRMRLGASVHINPGSNMNYMLVLFSIERGPFDEIIFWPFCYSLTFCLVDLTRDRKHIIKTISPDSTEAIFGKPENDVHKPYCIDQFCSIDDLMGKESRYIQENYMFMQLHVDFMGLGGYPFQSSSNET